MIERWEYEYKRHGTLTLIANFEVATGKVIAPSLGPTRTEADFADHIAKTLDTDPEAPWIFVMDQLNIHKSEAFVRLVAERWCPSDKPAAHQEYDKMNHVFYPLPCFSTGYHPS